MGTLWFNGVALHSIDDELIDEGLHRPNQRSSAAAEILSDEPNNSPEEQTALRQAIGRYARNLDAEKEQSSGNNILRSRDAG